MIVRLSVFIVSFVTLAMAGCSRTETTHSAKARDQKQPVEVVEVSRQDMAETLSVVGTLAPNESAGLRAEVAGLVKAISFDEGQKVKQGDVLMKIDDSELRTQLSQAEARFRLGELNLARSQNLVETKTIPQSEFDRASTEFASSQAELALLKVRLEKTELKAPFDGVIGSRSISVGDYLNASTIVTTIDDLSRLKIEFQVPERFLAKVQTGTKFTVAARSKEGRPQSTAGEVYFVSAIIERATRSTQVKGLMVNPPPGLKPGMFANVDLILDVRKDVLTVPEGAILTTPTATRVIAVRAKGGDNTAEFVDVNLGLRSKGVVEIAPVKGTLEPGDKVVSSGVGSLNIFPGVSLEPRPARKQFKD